MLFNTMINVAAGRAAWDVKYAMPAAQGGERGDAQTRGARDEKLTPRKMRASNQQARRNAVAADRVRQEYKLQAEDDGAVLLCRD